MKKLLGLIGGMSWESTELYCRHLNAISNERLGGYHGATFIVFSVDFGEIEALQAKGDWRASAEILIDAARRLEKAGADELLLCTNTMHIVADEISSAVSIPLLHIADATARHISAKSLRTVGLLATKYTMEGSFYRDRMAERHGLKIVTPTEGDRLAVNAIIYDELCNGIISASSKERFREIALKMISEGAEGVILGCTEVGMLLKRGDIPVPVFDSALIHAEEAMAHAAP